MNEYELMLVVVGIAAAVAWVFFMHLARMVVWSNRPKFDFLRYAVITVCLFTEIGETFEWWEAALLVAVSVLAYTFVRSQRARFESAIQKIAARRRLLTSERGQEPPMGS
ncbi:hypothetical protein [Acidovorax sp.]|jgi:hypothetical protein|uniref:hypothetical protein n=1 Tax=Acidovorax sp. TaxID=1872122 RepID=UPI0025BAEEFC|nr:hypothetical protein [Acidovorax sp.]MBL7091589.1 hypothetical protein [Acidovorax sp.]